MHKHISATIKDKDSMKMAKLPGFTTARMHSYQRIIKILRLMQEF